MSCGQQHSVYTRHTLHFWRCLQWVVSLFVTIPLLNPSGHHNYVYTLHLCRRLQWVVCLFATVPLLNPCGHQHCVYTVHFWRRLQWVVCLLVTVPLLNPSGHQNSVYTVHFCAVSCLFACYCPSTKRRLQWVGKKENGFVLIEIFSSSSSSFSSYSYSWGIVFSWYCTLVSMPGWPW